MLVALQGELEWEGSDTTGILVTLTLRALQVRHPPRDLRCDFSGLRRCAIPEFLNWPGAVIVSPIVSVNAIEVHHCPRV